MLFAAHHALKRTTLEVDPSDLNTRKMADVFNAEKTRATAKPCVVLIALERQVVLHGEPFYRTANRHAFTVA
jgi:hypothetical protein